VAGFQWTQRVNPKFTSIGVRPTARGGVNLGLPTVRAGSVLVTSSSVFRARATVDGGTHAGLSRTTFGKQGLTSTLQASARYPRSVGWCSTMVSDVEGLPPRQKKRDEKIDISAKIQSHSKTRCGVPNPELRLMFVGHGKLSPRTSLHVSRAWVALLFRLFEQQHSPEGLKECSMR